MTPVIEMRQVGLTYPGPPPVTGISEVDLEVEHGEYLAITGPSGSGKSTLMNLLGLLDTPTNGNYLLDGVDTSRLSQGELASLRGHRIGFVFQEYHLLPYRTAVENVTLAMVYAQRLTSRERERRAVGALERVGLGHRLHALPSQLSGGERQRVAVARALVNKPSLLLCDEPTGNLDSVTARGIMQLIDGLHDAQQTVLVVTHDPAVAARAARQVTIADGRLRETRS
jgi:putative ABC transport system ATP-binding protein